MGTGEVISKKVKEAPTAGGAAIPPLSKGCGIGDVLVLCSFHSATHLFCPLLVSLSFLNCATSGQSRWQYLARSERSL